MSDVGLKNLPASAHRVDRDLRAFDQHLTIRMLKRQAHEAANAVRDAFGIAPGARNI
ncbi:hypothetical protein [Amycolatopsis alkalitolerans]|uniref:hypothetical protein n=1 Tax=Amycolatopsis alkalitolerans TaxID=2547244 RepID=UPI0013598334|nr:hypothetical protein [Amycolatopsis alkalitolerans]